MTRPFDVITFDSYGTLIEVASHVSILACGVLREPSREHLRISRSALSGLSGEVGRCLPGYAPGAPGCVIASHPFNVRSPAGGTS